MKKKREQRNERALREMMAHLISREIEAVSDNLYSQALCEKDYPELAKLFESFAHEHSENIKLLGGVLISIEENSHLNIRANAKLPQEKNILIIIKALANNERENLLRYQKLYLLDITDLVGSNINKIVRASKKRLSTLETILKT